MLQNELYKGALRRCFHCQSEKIAFHLPRFEIGYHQLAPIPCTHAPELCMQLLSCQDSPQPHILMVVLFCVHVAESASVSD